MAALAFLRPGCTLSVLVVLLCSTWSAAVADDSAVALPPSAGGSWGDARATFYGGADASGTMGGACGYGNLYTTGFGDLTAAASSAMWNEGAVCGSCWEVTCVNSTQGYCVEGGTVIVTVTNECPDGSEGGWCDPPQHHLDLSYPAFSQIVNNYKAGVVQTQMRRVACPARDSVSFQLSGNPFWTQAVVYGISGPGDLSSVQVSTDSGETWQSLSRNWGSVWSGSGLLGKGLSWRLTTLALNLTKDFIDCVPSTWTMGTSYDCDGNFPDTALDLQSS